jgi:eukaryotic-like serine/threonine-protein kinase
MQPLKQVSIGRYEILAELGRGAMGVVYKARDPKIDRLVAIKTIALLNQDPDEEREFRARFFHEAQAAGRLSHPRIVTIFDVAEDPETQNPYIVMEYVPGHSLERELSEENGKLALETALQLTEEVAEALDYAHAQGIVHRDIKPANILLGEDGHPKIADFGIAKFNLANITSNGHAMGTPAYMSPEQLSGEAVDGRSDLFSVGVILYTMLTGYRPFQGNSAMTVSYKVVNRDPVPVSALDADIPPMLDYVVSRAMSKDRKQRYQTGMELALDISDLRQGFIPRSSMTSPGTATDPSTGSRTGVYEPALTARMEAVKLGSTATQVSRGVPRRRATWPIWQYAAVILMATGVLGIGFAMFRRPAYSTDSNLGQNGASTKPSAPENTQTPQQAQPVVVTQPLSAQADDTPQATVSSEEHEGQAHRSVAASRPKVEKKTSKLANAEVKASDAATTQVKYAAVPAAATPVSASRPASTLHIRVEHHFPSAEVWVWVDDKLAFSHLMGGIIKKRLGIFKGVQGFESESLRVSPGDHRFRVRVQSDDKTYDKSATVVGTLPQEGERALRISCDKHKPLQLIME